MISYKELIEIRKQLHQNPEHSGKEKITASFILSFLKKFQPTSIKTDLYGYGLAAIYDSKKPGPTIVFRAELDGLPIIEKNNFKHISQNPGYSHACGHDGHMTILLGMASYLNYHLDEIKGKIVLLFQPSEENAEGAEKISKSSFYKNLKPDYIYALHNIPGYKQGTLVIKNGVFSIASKGIIIELNGETTHAGNPDQGNNPVYAMAKIIKKIKNISDEYQTKYKQSFITIIHVKLGEMAFGTSPGTGIIMATLRAPNNKILRQMGEQLTTSISKISDRFNLENSIRWLEEFPVTNNNTNAVYILEQAAKHMNSEIVKIQEPFLWTEDFAYFLEKTSGSIFGLGAGLNHAPLHSQNYDFPDTIINHGIKIFIQIIKKINSNI